MSSSEVLTYPQRPEGHPPTLSRRGTTRATSKWPAPFSNRNKCTSVYVWCSYPLTEHRARQARNFDTNTRWVPTQCSNAVTTGPVPPRHKSAKANLPLDIDASAIHKRRHPSHRHAILARPARSAACPSVCKALPTGRFLRVLVGSKERMTRVYYARVKTTSKRRAIVSKLAQCQSRNMFKERGYRRLLRALDEAKALEANARGQVWRNLHHIPAAHTCGTVPGVALP
jgi:hypothetical protein